MFTFLAARYVPCLPTAQKQLTFVQPVPLLQTIQARTGPSLVCFRPQARLGQKICPRKSVKYAKKKDARWQLFWNLLPSGLIRPPICQTARYGLLIAAEVTAPTALRQSAANKARYTFALGFFEQLMMTDWTALVDDKEAVCCPTYFPLVVICCNMIAELASLLDPDGCLWVAHAQKKKKQEKPILETSSFRPFLRSVPSDHFMRSPPFN